MKGNKMSGLNVYSQTLEQYEKLTPEREVELITLIKNGDELAREEFIECNLKLVLKIAHDFTGKGLAIEDLVSVGNIGLMKAVDAYELGKGTKFSSYAALWIKQYMRKELSASSRAISFCSNTLEKMKKVKELKEQSENSSVDDIAKAMNTRSKNYIANLMNGYSEISLNQMIGDEDGRSFGDTIADENAIVGQEIETNELISLMMKHLKSLKDRERKVLIYRYGLFGKKMMTQKELAKAMDYTYQRIQSIEKEAIANLYRAMRNEI